MKFDKQYFKSFYPKDWEYQWSRYQKQERMFTIIGAITVAAAIVVAIIWIIN